MGSSRIDWSWRDKRLRTLLSDGWSAARIAKALGVSRSAVDKRISALKLVPPSQRRVPIICHPKRAS